MQFSLVCLTLAATAVALPAHESPNVRSTLAKRADALTFAWTNSCGPTVDGFPSCTKQMYVHYGDGQTSCKDKTVELSNTFCATTGTGIIHTPVGDGKFEKADSCDATKPDGTVMGKVTAGDTTWNCVKASGSASDNCAGLEYTSDIGMVCT